MNQILRHVSKVDGLPGGPDIAPRAIYSESLNRSSGGKSGEESLSPIWWRSSSVIWRLSLSRKYWHTQFSSCVRGAIDNDSPNALRREKVFTKTSFGWFRRYFSAFYWPIENDALSNEESFTAISREPMSEERRGRYASNFSAFLQLRLKHSAHFVRLLRNGAFPSRKAIIMQKERSEAAGGASRGLLAPPKVIKYFPRREIEKEREREREIGEANAWSRRPENSYFLWKSAAYFSPLVHFNLTGNTRRNEETNGRPRHTRAGN